MVFLGGGHSFLLPALNFGVTTVLGADLSNQIFLSFFKHCKYYSVKHLRPVCVLFSTSELDCLYLFLSL